MPNTADTQKEEIFAFQNIFGKPPGWLVYWGITCAFVFLVVCLGIAAFVKYPDKLVMPAKLFTENPPIEIISKMNAEIDSIYIKDKGTAHRNDVLLTFRSTLDEDDLGRLNAFFVDIDRVAYIPQYLTIAFPKGLHLGSLSTSYTAMMQNYEEFQHFLKQSAVFVKIKALSNEIEQIHKLNRSLTKQEEFFEQDVALTEKDFGRFLTLKEQGVIADVEKERAESKILNEKRNLEAFRSQKLNNEVRIEQLKTQISDLSSDRSSGVSTRIFTIHQLKERLLNEIKEWEEMHIVKAPFDGNIAYKSYLTKNQFVKAGDVLLNCIPHNTGNSYIAQGKLPLRASGTLQVGQNALLELESYPAAQFGVIAAKVSDFSAIPNEDSYLVRFDMPTPLITTYKKEIPQNQNMTANVNIQTKEYSLLERLFQNVWDVVKNK
ncbi:MAG: HlyD family efflux transporter periplasmic adaptor subunit [Saprospiraceae bacterium]